MYAFALFSQFLESLSQCGYSRIQQQSVLCWEIVDVIMLMTINKASLEPN